MTAENVLEAARGSVHIRPPTHSTGLPSQFPAMRRDAPRNFSVGSNLSRKAGWMKLVQEAVHI